MGLDPYKKRELVFLSLYSFDSGQDDGLLSDLVDLIAAECPADRAYVVEAVDRAKAIMGAREICDRYIAEVCQDYTIDRIQSVERNILRLAIFELVVEQKVPPKVVFSEARRLSKKFSTGEAASFVVALLGSVASAAGIVVEHTETE